MASDAPDFRWRGVLFSAILPTLAFSTGEGAILPMIPLVAENLGAGLAGAGLIAALLTLGALGGSIPGGWLVARVGERAAMVAAAALSAVGVTIGALADSPTLLGVGILMVGLAVAVFGLARHAFMTSFVPPRFRARALSTLGGTFRLGFFIGPFISAAVIQVTGDSQTAFWVHAVASAAAIVLLVTMPDPAGAFGPPRSRRALGGARQELGAGGLGVFRTFRSARGLLIRLGTGAALIAALRSSRQVILPLWAISIGLGEANTALIIGIAGGVDFALFYTGGWIMDRFGRIWTAVPSMLGLGAGLIVLAVSQAAAEQAAWFIGTAIFLAVANGIGSGVIMTLGADLADPRNPAAFLGAWRFTTECGGAAAPLLIAAVTGLASLTVATGLMGVLGVLGAAVLARYLPRYPSNA